MNTNQVKDCIKRIIHSKEPENTGTISGSALNDYRVYIPTKKEITDFYICTALACLVLGMLFYNSIWASLLLFCTIPLFEKYYLDSLMNKRRSLILESFKDSLYAISASVAAGRQLPRAVEDAADQAAMFYGPQNILSLELNNIVKEYKNTNTTIENLLKDFAMRTGIEEISLFASSCEICGRSGGDLEAVCLKSAYMIIEKIEFSQEAASILAEKKLDILILAAMPLITLFFLSVNSFDYIEILYTSFQGRIIMTFSLFMMAAACLWSLKIMNVKI